MCYNFCRAYVTEGDYHRVSKIFTSDKKGIHLISIAALIITVAVLVVLEILRRYLVDKFPEYLPNTEGVLPQEVVSVLMIVFSAIYVVFIVIILPLWYRTIRYELTDNCLITDTGLFSRSHKIMKYSAIQHVSHMSVPLSFRRKNHFNFISVNAMGGNVVLLFLSDADCKIIMEALRGTAEAAAPAVKTRQERINDTINMYEKSNSAREKSAGTVTYTSSNDLADYFGGSEGYTQLSFDAPDEAVQLSFGDTENGTVRQTGGNV